VTAGIRRGGAAAGRKTGKRGSAAAPDLEELGPMARRRGSRAAGGRAQGIGRTVGRGRP